MRTVLTCIMEGTRFFLTSEGYATDIPERACDKYRDRHEAALAAIEVNQEWRRWKTWKWQPAIIMSDGNVVVEE